MSMQRLAQELERLTRTHRRRSLELPKGVDFTSNDYLGLVDHPAVRQAMRDALGPEDIVGAGGSRLLRGHQAAHARLESTAADFFGVERALYLSTGFLANYALFTVLPHRRDAIVYDALLHASALEGIHASHARRYKVAHNDVDAFEHAVRRARADGAHGVWIAVESLYSMDGDTAPLDGLADIAARLDAVLIIDEAHATGVLGPNGRGLGEALHADANVITLHTCGKAMGVAGALVCAPAVAVETLINSARPFIYSTAPPPAVAEAVRCALTLIKNEPWRRERVLRLGDRLARALKPLGAAVAPDTGTQIRPVMLGANARAVAVAREVQAAGFDVRAIRPPTVPAGTARLRVSLSASRGEAEVDALAGCLIELLSPVAADA
jgi:8-amino-7-oxononanoate synthase